MPDGKGGAWLAGTEIHVAGSPVFLSRRVNDLLREEARRRLGALVQDVSDQTGLRPARLAIRDTRSRWGSCTAGGTVMFKLAPGDGAAYRPALRGGPRTGHLRHLNHGPHFWNLVRTGAPDMPAAIAWLKRHGSGLMRAGQLNQNAFSNRSM